MRLRGGRLYYCNRENIVISVVRIEHTLKHTYARTRARTHTQYLTALNPWLTKRTRIDPLWSDWKSFLLLLLLLMQTWSHSPCRELHPSADQHSEAKTQTRQVMSGKGVLQLLHKQPKMIRSDIKTNDRRAEQTLQLWQMKTSRFCTNSSIAIMGSSL